MLPWLVSACSVALLAWAAVLRLAAGEQAVSTVVVTLALVSFPCVGAVIASRLPGMPYGWVWCALGIALALVALTLAHADRSGPEGWWVVAMNWLGYLGLAGLLVFVFLLYPTGRVPGPAWRWLSRATVGCGVLLALATPVAPSVLAPTEFEPPVPDPAAGRVLVEVVTAGSIGLLVLVFFGVASLVPRFRRAGPVERQQLKWFLLAAAVNAVYFAADLMTGVSTWLGGWVLTHVVVGALVPVAVAAAVLRYRLYEIDRLISRTVSYGLLTGGVVALFLVLVAVLRPLLEPLTGGSNLAVAGSTLAVAAVFDPARRRLQEVVDRRFDRARYDARRAVDAFAARLRDQVDQDEISAGLRDTVVATVAPTRVAVWVRKTPSVGGA